jgi:hypothetical protein
MKDRIPHLTSRETGQAPNGVVGGLSANRNLSGFYGGISPGK